MANISVVQKSSLANTSRFDAEYYQPHHLVTAKRILAQNNTTLDSAGAVMDCSAFYPSIVDEYSFDGKGIPFLRVNEIQGGMVRITEDTAFLPPEIIEKYKSNIAKAYPGDIVIAKGGNTLGKVGLLTDRYDQYSVSRDLIIVRTNELKDINRYYVWMFLNSKVGQEILLRTASLTGQPHLTLSGVGGIKLPILGDTSVYEDIFIKSRSLAKEAADHLKEARDFLLKDLGIRTQDLKLQRNYSSTLALGTQLHRIDAQYYNPTYYSLESQIRKYSGGWDYLPNLFKVSETRIRPVDAEYYDYIELSNIDAAVGQIIDKSVYEGGELPGRARMKVEKNDLVVASVEGSIKKIAWVKDETENLVASTGFFVLKEEYFDPLVGYILLSSPPVNNLLKREAQGSILSAVQAKSLSRVVVPKLRDETAKKLKELVKNSDTCYEESVKLISTAIQKLNNLYGSTETRGDFSS